MSGTLIASCGSSSGSSDETAGIGGTGIVAGRITGFGSIFVNDTRYTTPSGTRFVIDGVAGSQGDLKVGMVVRIEAETENGAFTGEAIEVVYENDLQGPIDNGSIAPAGASQKNFTVFGQTITIDDTDTRFEGTAFSTIDDTIVVEISGFRTSPSEIFATFVKKTSNKAIGSEVELRGLIDMYDMGPPETLEIDGIDIEVDPAATVDVEGGVLQNSLFVEVEGEIMSLAPLTVRALAIESEDADLGDDVDDVRLEGIVSGYVAGPPTTFLVDGQAVDASSAVTTPAGAVIADGVEVEVEGDIVGGVLFADEVEVEAAESGVRSFVATVDTGNSFFTADFPFTAGLSTTVVIRVNAQTVFEDEKTGGTINTVPFSLDDLVDGGFGSGTADYVIVKGEEINDEIIATLVKRVDFEDKLELEGVIDAYTAGAGGSITVLGIEYGLNGFTQYSPDPNFLPGDFVELADEDDPPNYAIDGIADEVEEDD
ncbi:MAG: DUF5666 domain-containing protein [Gammaproteobacteria bacterium]|nr:DUF5666 domain-containing protein [Gammaproteobacteria bacterium]